MNEVQITGPDDVDLVIDSLNKMPMSRKFGKGVVARLPGSTPEVPAAVYIRVSTSKQADEGKGSLFEQFQAVWKETLRRGGQPVAVYADICTAANRNRMAFNALIADLRAGNIAMVGCWHSTRLVRTQLAAGELEDALEHLNRPVKMFAVTDTLDADLLGVLAWAGRWERKAFRERSLMGRQAAVADNRPPSGNPPFWIEVTRDEEGKPAGFILKAIAEWISWAAKAYANGMGSTEIVARLNRERVPRATGLTKYGWTRQYLAQILKYPALKGKWGPFWGQWVDIPALIDEAAWDQIQARMKENQTSPGRPAKFFVALRGLLWCGVCGQKMQTHVRDWDYTYKVLKDGTKARYRVQKSNLRIKHVCGGQQQYGLKCRKPEYVHDKVLFPKVWEKLSQALENRDILIAGLDSQLQALEKNDDVEELKHVDRQLEKLRERELSYAEQQAEGIITAVVHKELTLRLQEAKRELVQTKYKLTQMAKLVEQARLQRDQAKELIKKLPEVISNTSRQEQEELVRALIVRVDVSSDNQVAITLRLAPEVIRDLPNRLQDSSLLPESELSSDSQMELMGNSKSSAASRHGQLMTAARYRRSMGCMRN